MSFAPPPGPPPPAVPEGWKAQFDDRYKQWFFVNLRTGKSQWESPQGPAQEELHAPPSEAPPSYEESGPTNPSVVHGANEKKSLGSNNPYNQAGARSSSLDSDARLAAQLQAEEDAHARISRSPRQQAQPGAAADYYTEASQPQLVGYRSSSTPSQQITDPEQKRSRGFLSKLMGKASSGSGGNHERPSSQQSQPNGYPPGVYGFYPQQPAARRHGGGMGTAGAAALGVGGGLLGGALLAEALNDHDYNDYGSGGYDDFGGGDFGDF
ncbi:WW domain protein [Aspergillus bombycis]|uniref:WW domain protein n=1 Tax=Aspergillus bombycis TaxID=109264 RepID=A0A1F7ZVU3_9EURO|nr:WW domain protein [Aspergillus bombycis]OGM43554.1 WW domain protein [Aspergillus bombycis]